jgi:hypothetical protein
MEQEKPDAPKPPAKPNEPDFEELRRILEGKKPKPATVIPFKPRSTKPL